MSAPDSFITFRNGEAVSWSGIPAIEIGDLVARTAEALSRGGRLCSWFGVPEHGSVCLVAVIAYDADHRLAVGRSRPMTTRRYPALTPIQPQAHLFEREVWEQFGVVPEEHPWLKPVRRSTKDYSGSRGFFAATGSEVHEVAVGPVHAGIIEPGHFRFQCVGEEVLHLEIALGYQHRGIEKAMVGGPYRVTPFQMETVAGDTSVGHAMAYASVMEALAGTDAPARAQWLRSAALELERLANHCGDLGALAGDVAFLPTASACGKIRGDFLNLTATICGNRFGRGIVRPGGCGYDVDDGRLAGLRSKLGNALDDVIRVTDWLWDSGSVRARFEGAGRIEAVDSVALGIVGPPVRACGVARDIRADHPAGWFRARPIPVSLCEGGDVSARARIRRSEIERSGEYLTELLAAPEEGSVISTLAEPRGDTLAVSLIEGWRGEICHVALTGNDGRFRRYKITDPSFHNWTALAMALRGQAVSDFPICNKSFNLSYCGFDL